jgi:hypothetical protein
MEDIMARINHLLEVESTVREKLKPLVNEVDGAVRLFMSNSQKLHSNPKQNWQIVITEMEKTLKEAVKPSFAKLKSGYDEAARERLGEQSAGVNAVVDMKRHSFMWQNSLRDCIYLLAFLEWLKENRLLSMEETIQRLEFSHIDVEDYLFGISQLPATFARICVQCVIAQDLKTPFQIAEFNHALFAGFRLLNLKNDGLRRRIDSLKYDFQRIEDCIFDLSIRKLVDPSTTGSDALGNDNKKRKIDTEKE